MAKRILSIDDDQDILDVIDLVLSLAGYEVQTALSPENIGNLILEFKPDLILLDIKMGKYNGLNVCKQLKSNPFMKDIPVIMISSDQSICTAVSEYGANDVLLKPFDITSLENKAAEYLLAKIVPINRISA